MLPLIVLVITWIVIAAMTPTFRGQASVFSVLQGFPLIGLAALGLAVTIIAGEFDLSVGSMAALSAVIAVIAASTGLVGCIVIAVAVCTALGALQGTLIGRLGINSLVFTIGTLILLRGLTYMLSQQRADHDREFRDHRSAARCASASSRGAASSRIVVFVLAGFFLTYTRWGREIFAIGGARNEAIAAGVPRVRPLADRLRHLGLLREPRRRARRHARRQRGAAELRGPAARPAAPRRSSAASASMAAAARCSTSRSASPSCRWSAPGSRRAAASASLVQLVTGALLLTVITIEFLAGRLTLGNTVFGRAIPQRAARRPAAGGG